MGIKIIRSGAGDTSKLKAHPLYAKALDHLSRLPDQTSQSYLRGLIQVGPDSELSQYIKARMRQQTRRGDEIRNT